MRHITAEEDDRPAASDQRAAMNDSRRATGFALCFRAPVMTVVVGGTFALGLLMGAGLSQGASDAVAESSLTGQPEFVTLEKTWELIHEQWPDPEGIDDAALIYGATKGMVDAIGDEGHSTFLDPDAAAEFARARESSYVGIGVEVDSRCGVPVVAATMEDSPARAAGLLPGDVITEVNSVSTRRVDMRELKDLILGEEGDPLTLTIERASEPAPLTIEVVRQTISTEAVTWRWLPERTVQLRITGFEPGVSQKVREALQTIRDAGAQRLILDLRGNPGGLVPEVIGVGSQFLDEGKTIFQEDPGEGDPRPIKTVGRDGHWLDLALVVLIDDGSASGAEVLAAALRDNGRARLIGDTTFGTGTVLTTFPHNDGSSLVLATAFWLTPEGERVWQEGVDPDQFVSLQRDVFPSRPEDDPVVTATELATSADTQLQAAFSALDTGAALS